MFKTFDLAGLRRNPRVAYYFRYPLHHSDFRELRSRQSGRLIGRYAAKPLFGKLDAQGRVDKSSGFNGQIAVLFIPAGARSPQAAQLLLTRTNRDRLTLPNGRRNWQVIRSAAERAIRTRETRNRRRG